MRCWNMADVDDTFLREALKRIQSDLSELKEMRHEMREGFASLKAHNAGLIGEVFSHERRILNLKDDLLRLKSELDQTE